MSLTALQREADEIGLERFTARDHKPGEQQHIVQFRYRADVSEAQRAEVAERFLALAAAPRTDGRPYIRSIITGAQSSGEPTIVADFHQAFVVVFDSEGDRNFYVGEPVISDPEFFDAEHARFKEFVGPLIDAGGIAVFDFAVA